MIAAALTIAGVVALSLVCVSAASAAVFPTVDAGAAHTCAVKTDATLTCWGSNGEGQATPPAGSFTSVTGGTSHSCAVKTDATLACWGNNGYEKATPP